MTTQASPLSSSGLRAPLRHRDFRLLVTGQALASFGDMHFVVALPFLFLASGSGHGAGDLAATMTALGLARLIGTPIGGRLADHWHPASVMLVADLGRAGALLLFLPWPGLGPTGLGQLLCGAILLGLLESLFLPAYRAVTPTLVAPDELEAANSTGEAANVVAVIAGPLVAGALVVAIGPGPAIAINAATFLVSALTLLSLRSRRSTVRRVDLATPSGEATRSTVSFIRSSPLLSQIIIMLAVLSLGTAGIVSVALPVLVVEQFGDRAGIFGAFLGGFGVGMLAGTLGVGLIRRSGRVGRTAMYLLAIHAVALAWLPFLPWVAGLTVFTIVGVADGALGVLVLTMVQQRAPDGLRGRVMAVYTMARTSTYPLGAGLAGIAVLHLGAPAVFLIAGVVTLAVAGFGLASRSISTV